MGKFPWIERRGIAAALALSTAACAPIPHTVTLSPAITGIVEAQGRQVQGLSVFVSHGSLTQPCERPVKTVQTSADGKFAIPRRTAIRVVYSPLRAALEESPFKVCLLTEQGAILGYWGNTSTYGGPKLDLRCSLPLPPLDATRMAIHNAQGLSACKEVPADAE